MKITIPTTIKSINRIATKAPRKPPAIVTIAGTTTVAVLLSDSDPSPSIQVSNNNINCIQHLWVAMFRSNYQQHWTMHLANIDIQTAYCIVRSPPRPFPVNCMMIVAIYAGRFPQFMLFIPDLRVVQWLTGSGIQLAFLWHTDVNTSVLSCTSEHQNVTFDPSKVELWLE